jgi:parallel beta-helix repeat protein
MRRLVSGCRKWCAAAAFCGATAFAQDISAFGARCDGSDDSAAVQAAINATPSGGTVTISCAAAIGPSGIVLADKNSVTVTGSGGSSGLRALAATRQSAGGFSSVLFVVRNCANCVVKDLAIDNANVGAVGVGFDRCTGSTLQNVSVSNTGYPASAAIVATGGSGNQFLGNSVRSTGRISTDGTRGMWIGNGGTQTEQNATIANNTVTDTGATGIAAHVNNTAISENLVVNAYGAGIKICPTSGLGGQSSIQGNTIRGSQFHGVQISKADTPVIVERNTIDGNKGAGIYASDGAFLGRITGNTITNNPEAGIYLYNGSGVRMDNNTVTGNGHGILMETINGYTLRDLEITGNSINGQTAHGITVWGRGGTLSNLAVSANSITNGLQYGVFIDQTKGNKLSGISVSTNCFSNNAAGTIYDSRGQVAPVASSGSCTATSPGSGDSTAPSVSISAPSNGAMVEGTIIVSADATDNVGVAGVQFQLNGAPYGTRLTSAPYTALWDTRSIGNGNYQWNAVAQDAAGNTTISTTVMATVKNVDTTAPTVSITSPAAGATLSANVTLSAAASDNAGVAGVQFLVDGAPYGAEATSGYSVNLRTTSLTNGAHTLGAIARDFSGNKTAATTITVTVANGAKKP